jgi:exonuclease-1
MGIKGLHKGLSFCTEKTSIREFSGQRIAVDCSSWLHKSVYSVSEKYVESIEQKVVDANCVRVSARYISGRCRELLNNFRIKKVFLVMDGKRCPMKSDENEDREQRRQHNLKEARNYKRIGRRDKAEDKYKMCIKIRDDFTISVMNEVAKSFSRDQRVQFVWSPYEADAQLARLCIDRQADAVVTEVSRRLFRYVALRMCLSIILFLN